MQTLQGGGLPSAKLIDVVKLQKPIDLPAFGTADAAHRFRRVRYLDALPVALEEIWLDGDCAPHIAPEDVSESLYHYYQSHLGLIITNVEDWVGLAPPPLWHKPSAQDPNGAQMGFIERFGWSQHANKIEYSRTWFAPERAHYTSRLR